MSIVKFSDLGINGAKKRKLDTIPFVESGFWTPDMLTGITHWYDGSDTANITLNGSTVSSWGNRVDGTDIATQTSAGRQPVYNANGYLEFTGDDHMYADGVASGVNTTGPFYVFALTKRNDVTKMWRPWAFGGVVAGTWEFIQVTSDPLPAGFSAYTTNTMAAAVSRRTGGENLTVSNVDDTVTNVNSDYIFSTTVDWSEDYMFFSYNYLNVTGDPSRYARVVGKGVLDNITNIQNSLYTKSSAKGKFTIGTLNRINNKLTIPDNDANFYQLIVAQNDSVSVEDAQRLEGWAAHKYGLQTELPADHPYRSIPPTT